MYKPMPDFESEPVFASDLEWTLQSGQAEPAMLAEALTAEHFADLYSLSCAFLGNREAALDAARDIWVSALLNAYRYREAEGVRDWLYRLALGELQKSLYWTWAAQALDRIWPEDRLNDLPSESAESIPCLNSTLAELDASTRMALLLKVLNHFSDAEIAKLLKEDQSRVQKRFAAAVQVLHDTGLLEPDSTDDPDSEGQDFSHESLRQLILDRCSHRNLSEEDRAAFIAGVVRRVAHRRAVQRRWNAVKEAVFIGLAVLLVAGGFWAVNRWFPDTEPTPTPLPTRVIAAGNSAGTPTPGSRRRAERTPTPTPSGVLYRVEAGEDLAAVAARLGVIPEDLRRFNRLPRGFQLQAGQLVANPNALPGNNRPTFTPVTPVTPGPLLETSQLSEISSLMQRASSNWNTLWFDAQVRDYSSRSAAEGPRVSRLQAWFGGDHALILTGTAGGQPERIYLFEGRRVSVSRPGKGEPWFGHVHRRELESSPTLNAVLEIFNLHPSRESMRRWEISRQVIRREESAGRDAWLVSQAIRDFHRESMLWVDVETGLTLRLQEFGDPLTENALLKEIRISSIQYDVDLPEELFDRSLPWRGGFARDPSGRADFYAADSENEPVGAAPEIQFYRYPPDDFDLRGSPVSFQSIYQQNPGRFWNGQDEFVADLFAGRYFLGPVALGDPKTLICQRSPDGEKLAYVSHPYGRPQHSHAFLRWISLENPSESTRQPLGGVHVTRFAFAPDSRRIAVFGYDGQYAIGSLVLVDTETADHRLLAHLVDVRSMAWSRRGDFLALIGSPQLSYRQELIIIQIESGQVVYRSTIDIADQNTFNERWVRGMPAAWWHAFTSTVQFPTRMGSLESCTNPPA